MFDGFFSVAKLILLNFLAIEVQKLFLFSFENKCAILYTQLTPRANIQIAKIPSIFSIVKFFGTHIAFVSTHTV